MTLIASLVLLIAALIALVSYLYTKNRNQAVINQNDAVKATIANNNTQIVVNQAAIQDEKVKQQQIQDNINKASQTPVSQQQIDDFFNKNGGNGSNN